MWWNTRWDIDPAPLGREVATPAAVMKAPYVNAIPSEA